MDGGLQQYAIGKAAHVAKIPEGGPLDVIAAILCAAVTVCTRWLPIVPTKLTLVGLYSGTTPP